MLMQEISLQALTLEDSSLPLLGSEAFDWPPRPPGGDLTN